MKIRYDGPASVADFSQAVGAAAGTEKYTFVPNGEYTLNKDEADKILDRTNHYVDHRFTIVTGDETPPVVVPTSVKEA